MRKKEATFLFPVKSHGWGWGLPGRWQDWFVLGSYFVLLYLGIRYFRAERNFLGLLVYLGVITVVLIAIIAIKGERPLRWRWGK
jgi:hypothetical protein